MTDEGNGNSTFTIQETTISAVVSRIRDGELTAEDLTERYLKRIEKLDSELQSIIQVNPDARKHARELDRRFEEDGLIGPLHGVPILLKDNIETAGITTTAGCKALARNVPNDNATVVTRLKDAGGVILAKTNLYEFALHRYSRSSLGGQTYNPYDVSRTPGGSSGGTGASIAANLGLVGIGTDTGGSVRIPSSFNSLVGVRPTTGLVSRTGLIPLSNTQDTAGPMTRTVADAATLLDVMTGFDPLDHKTATNVVASRDSEATYTDALREDGLDDARIGVLRNHFDFGDETTEMTEIIEDAIHDISDAGAEVIDPVQIDNVTRDNLFSIRVRDFEMKRDLNNYLENTSSTPDTLQDILHSGQYLEEIEEELQQMNYVDVDSLQKNADYLYGLVRRGDIREKVLSTFARNDLDVVLYPTMLHPPSRVGEKQPGLNTLLSAVTDSPAITVPAGYTETNRLPVGVEFLGKPLDESTILEIAYSYEQHTNHRRAPRLSAR